MDSIHNVENVLQPITAQRRKQETVLLLDRFYYLFLSTYFKKIDLLFVFNRNGCCHV